MQKLKQAIKFIIRAPLIPFILKDMLAYKQKNDGRFPMPMHELFPCIRDKTIGTSFDRHYVYHTAWAARVVQEIAPKKHIDISSSLYFSSIVSAHIPIDFYDYRPANLELSNLKSTHADLMHLPFDDNSVQSISCLHTIEHIGLGRYGDLIDPQGDLKALAELCRVTAIGGNLLIVVPVGVPRIQFNAHRIYSVAMVIDAVTKDGNMILKEFSYIPQYESEGPMVRNASLTIAEKASYACGCFWFKKI